MECRDAAGVRPEQALVALDQNSTIIAVVELSQSMLEPSPERQLAVLHRWRDLAALDASARSPAPLSLRQQH